MIERGSIVNKKLDQDFVEKNPLIVEADNNLTSEVAKELKDKINGKVKE